MIKVACYCRVSTEEQAQHGISIEAQTEALTAWTKQNDAIAVDYYIDAGISARKKHNKRPALMRLLEDVKAGKIDLIIFTKLDRWFRNIAEYYKVQEILEKYNVGWKTIFEDYDTLTAAGRLKINIMLSVAQDEADRTSERIKIVFENKKAKKEPVSGNMPTGYKLVGKTIEFDDDWKETIQIFFDSYIKYVSPITAIVDAYEATGKRISRVLADIMLKNKAYCGYFNDVQGMCPQYITEEQFEEIQRLRGHHPKRPNTGRIYMFGGIIRCGVCGNRMSGCCQKSKHKDGTVTEIKYYNCQTHYRGKECNNCVNIGEKTVEEEALRQLPLEWEKAIYNADLEPIEPKPVVDTAKIKRRLDRLQQLYLNDMIEIEAYKKEYDTLHTELSKVPDKPKNITQIKELINSTWRQDYAKFDNKHKRAFWHNVLNSVTISNDRQITVNTKIF